MSDNRSFQSYSQLFQSFYFLHLRVHQILNSIILPDI